MTRVQIVALILSEGGKTLVERRFVGGGGVNSGAKTVHTFPAGHVEDGEEHEEALIREMGEELGISLDRVLRVYEAPVRRNGVTMDITWFICLGYEGVVENLEGQDLLWLTEEEMSRRMHPVSIKALKAAVKTKINL